MNRLDNFLASGNVESKDTYNFLVVAALQEELNAFYKLDAAFEKKIPKAGRAFEVSIDHNGSNIKILTFSPNKMGMPYNAASIMRIINLHNPYYILMIGTCACINRAHQLGDVLIPDRVFSYESGKYENGVFKPDYVAHTTGDELRKQSELLKSTLGATLSFDVITDEDFCSGAAVVDDIELSREIIDRCSRKLAGLDMEAYSISCINHILRGDNELLVIKGISDFAKDKTAAEQEGNKELAKTNAAQFALHLIKHLQETIFGNFNEGSLKPLSTELDLLQVSTDKIIGEIQEKMVKDREAVKPLAEITQDSRSQRELEEKQKQETISRVNRGSAVLLEDFSTRENDWHMPFWHTLTRNTVVWRHGFLEFEAIPSMWKHGSNGAILTITKGIKEGQVYQITAKVKAGKPNTTMAFQLWVHDSKENNNITEPKGDFMSVSSAYKEVSLLWEATHTNTLSIHLHCRAGDGSIVVKGVRVIRLASDPI